MESLDSQPHSTLTLAAGPRNKYIRSQEEEAD